MVFLLAGLVSQLNGFLFQFFKAAPVLFVGQDGVCFVEVTAWLGLKKYSVAKVGKVSNVY